MPSPIIVLVAPQLGENIGAVARAMGNFGLSELRIVRPRDGWPNPAAEAMAAHAAPIIQSARIFPSLPEAIGDCHRVYATSARLRDMRKPTVTARECAQQIPSNEKTAFLFGRENSGLSNDELTYAHALLTIPVDPTCPSINLAQAVVITAYEWFQAQHSPITAELDKKAPPASQQELYSFFDQLEQQLDQGYFWKVIEKKPRMWRNIRNLFLRAEPSSQEVNTLHGILSALTRQK